MSNGLFFRLLQILRYKWWDLRTALLGAPKWDVPVNWGDSAEDGTTYGKREMVGTDARYILKDERDEALVGVGMRFGTVRFDYRLSAWNRAMEEETKKRMFFKELTEKDG